MFEFMFPFPGVRFLIIVSVLYHLTRQVVWGRSSFFHYQDFTENGRLVDALSAAGRREQAKSSPLRKAVRDAGFEPATSCV
jgi:hypothetical protein